MSGKLIYRIALILIILLTVMLLPRVAYDYNPAFRKITLLLTFLRVSLLFFLLAEISRFLNDFIIRSSLKDWIKNTATLFYALLAILIILEGVFMFIGRSHYAGYTMSAKIWFYRNWKPLNEYGFRDKPVQPGRSFNVFVIGDSYTAGHGLKNYTERYSNLLEEKLAPEIPDAQVINLGRNGADTHEEYTLMEKFIKESGTHPDYLILQYFGNDIEEVAYRNGLSFPGFARYADLPAGVSEFVESSYLLNYIYWLYPHGDVTPYIDFLQTAYKDTLIFREHLTDIDLFVNYSRMNQIPLLIVIFPFLQDEEMSREMYVNRMASHFDSLGIPWIDVSTLVSGIPVSERVVNNNDAHPGTLTNRLVAEKLHEVMTQKP